MHTGALALPPAPFTLTLKFIFCITSNKNLSKAACLFTFVKPYQENPFSARLMALLCFLFAYFILEEIQWGHWKCNLDFVCCANVDMDINFSLYFIAKIKCFYFKPRVSIARIKKHGYEFIYSGITTVTRFSLEKTQNIIVKLLWTNKNIKLCCNKIVRLLCPSWDHQIVCKPKHNSLFLFKCVWGQKTLCS